MLKKTVGIEGDNVSMKCEIDTSKAVTVQWFHGDKLIEDNEKYNLNHDGKNLMLNITNLNVSIFTWNNQL